MMYFTLILFLLSLLDSVISTSLLYLNKNPRMSFLPGSDPFIQHRLLPRARSPRSNPPQSGSPSSPARHETAPSSTQSLAPVAAPPTLRPPRLTTSVPGSPSRMRTVPRLQRAKSDPTPMLTNFGRQLNKAERKASLVRLTDHKSRIRPGPTMEDMLRDPDANGGRDVRRWASLARFDEYSKTRLAGAYFAAADVSNAAGRPDRARRNLAKAVSAEAHGHAIEGSNAVRFDRLSSRVRQQQARAMAAAHGDDDLRVGMLNLESQMKMERANRGTLAALQSVAAAVNLYHNGGKDTDSE